MIFPVKVTEHILITFITGSKNYKLDSILAKLIHHICDQIKPFLICQSWYNTYHHRLRIFLQSKISLQLKFVLNFLFSESCCIISLCDIWICFRIEFIVINTIYNSTQAICTRTHQTVQFFSIERCLDFLCISIAYSSDCICKHNTALQIVGIFICFQFVCCKIIIGQSCDILDCLYIPYTLEFKVMYCHDRLDIPEKFILLEAVVQIYGNKSGLPVMTVYNIRSESDNRKNWQYSFGEECKFLQIPCSSIIRFGSAEIVFIVNKIKLNSFVLHVHDSYIAVLISKIHVEMCDIVHFIFPFLFHTGIFR